MRAFSCLVAALLAACAGSRSAVRESFAASTPALAPAKAAAPDAAGAPSAPAEMFERQGELLLEAADVLAAAVRLRALAREHGAQLTTDSVGDASGAPRGDFVLRVPADRLEALVDAVAEIGRVLSRRVSAVEVGAVWRDTELQLKNLRAAAERYQALMAAAKDVKDMLAVEAELSRLRGQIDALEASKRGLEDRVARAVLRVTLLPVRGAAALSRAPRAKFNPGLRGTWVTGLASAGTTSLAGGGLSLRFLPEFGFDLDVLRVLPGREAPVPDGYLLTMSLRAFSEFLGGGSRRFLNPWLGMRVGGARVLGDGRFVAGVEAGVELLRTKAVVVDLQLGALGLAGSGSAPDLALQASLAAYVPF